MVVCKMDIENVEHQVLPELLAVPSTLRLIDELFDLLGLERHKQAAKEVLIQALKVTWRQYVSKWSEL